MKNQRALYNRLDRKFSFNIVFLLSIILIVGPSNPALGQLPDVCSREIEIFAQQKNRAEDFARLLKKRYEKRKLSEQTLLKGEALYNDAKAAFNAYISQFQFDIRAGREPSQKNLQMTIEKSEKFTAFADEQVYGAPRGPAVIALVGAIISALAKAGTDFWKEYRKANQQEREALAKDLEKLKWQSFEQIK